MMGNVKLVFDVILRLSEALVFFRASGNFFLRSITRAIVNSFWNHFEIILGSFWDHFRIILGSFKDHFGIILGLFWDHFGISLGLFWDYFGDHFAIFLESFWDNFGMILEPFGEEQEKKTKTKRNLRQKWRPRLS